MAWVTSATQKSIHKIALKIIIVSLVALVIGSLAALNLSPNEQAYKWILLVIMSTCGTPAAFAFVIAEEIVYSKENSKRYK